MEGNGLRQQQTTSGYVCLPSCLALLLRFSLHTLAKAVRLADELKNVGFVRETVQQGCSQMLVAEDLSPVGEAQIGRDGHRYPFVQRGAELEHQLRTRT